MNFINFLIILFLLGAFTVGIVLTDVDKSEIDLVFVNATKSIDNITLDYTQENYENIPNVEGLFDVLEKFIKFVGALVIEVFKAGIHFGHDNPDYFEPAFLINIMKLLVVLFIIGLLIKPVGYLLIFLVLIIISIYDKIKKRRKKKLELET